MLALSKLYFSTSLFLLFINVIIASNVHTKSHRHDASFIPDAILRVTAKNISQSCLPSKLTVLVNGTAPGPELRIVEGQTYWIRVYNDMTGANLTMHWHGLSMAVSPFSDGTPQASQWPIPAHHFFDYEIHVPVGMAGTYFYHSHTGFQAVSAAGPLIVEDTTPLPYYYDEERIIFLSDVFAKTDETIERGILSNPFQWSGETAMVLVNGKGGGSNNGTYCKAELEVIHVEPDKTYRFRFIGGTALTLASIAIQGHDSLTVIEADGSYTKPHSTSFLQIGSGQRYSILLKTKSSPGPHSFYIQVETRERPTVTRSFAVLKYDQDRFIAPTTSQITLPNTQNGFLDYALSPLRPSHFPSANEVTRRVTITVHQHHNGTIVWQQNSLPWTETYPKEPYLVSLYKNDSIEFPSYTRALQNNGIDPVTRAFPAMIGEVIEIVFQNTGSDLNAFDVHPLHAHGEHYWDIGAGNGTYDPHTNELRLQGTEPLQRDTTMLYRYAKTATPGLRMGWRAWRLRIQEPGVWMIHCHTLQHMLMGMQTVWVMGNSSELLGKVPRPEIEGYLTFGGDVYGNKSHWPTVVHWYDNWASDA